MTFTEFLNKYSGKKVDYDGKYGFQCVDLIRQYHQDVIGGRHTGAVTGAVEFWTRFGESKLPEYYNRHNITMAEAGDIVVFDRTVTNKYGHIALFIRKDKNGILVFEQDGLRQDGAKFAVRSLDRVLGCLKPKEEIKV